MDLGKPSKASLPIDQSVQRRLDLQVYGAIFGTSILNILGTLGFMWIDRAQGTSTTFGLSLGALNILLNIPRIALAFFGRYEQDSSRVGMIRKGFVSIGALISLSWVGYSISVMATSGVGSESSKLSILFSCAQLAQPW